MQFVQNQYRDIVKTKRNIWKGKVLYCKYNSVVICLIYRLVTIPTFFKQRFGNDTNIFKDVLESLPKRKAHLKGGTL